MKCLLVVCALSLIAMCAAVPAAGFAKRKVSDMDTLEAALEELVARVSQAKREDRLKSLEAVVEQLVARQSADQLTEEQVAGYRYSFKLFDKNNNNFISQEELGFMMRALGQNPSEAELQFIMSQVDNDGSGVIDFPEFVRMELQREGEGVSEQNIREDFRTFDLDGNGYITASEMKVTMINLGQPLSDGEIEIIINGADSNGDGQVTYEEFHKMKVSQQ